MFFLLHPFDEDGRDGWIGLEGRALDLWDMILISWRKGVKESSPGAKLSPQSLNLRPQHHHLLLPSSPAEEYTS
jgi:hypothetical protein